MFLSGKQIDLIKKYYPEEYQEYKENKTCLQILWYNIPNNVKRRNGFKPTRNSKEYKMEMFSLPVRLLIGRAMDNLYNFFSGKISLERIKGSFFEDNIFNILEEVIDETITTPMRQDGYRHYTISADLFEKPNFTSHTWKKGCEPNSETHCKM